MSKLATFAENDLPVNVAKILDMSLTELKTCDGIRGYACYIFSSPEHKVLKLSFCGHPVSVVCRQHLPCGHSRGHIFCSMVKKFGQNVCLDKISNNFIFGSPGIKN